jgi:hypothetical protein
MKRMEKKKDEDGMDWEKKMKWIKIIWFFYKWNW